MADRGTIYNGLELTPAKSTSDPWLLEVRQGQEIVGRIRRDPVSGTYCYYRLPGNPAPLHVGNDLATLLKWVAHKP